MKKLWILIDASICLIKMPTHLHKYIHVYILNHKGEISKGKKRMHICNNLYYICEETKRRTTRQNRKSYTYKQKHKQKNTLRYKQGNMHIHNTDINTHTHVHTHA